MSNKPIHPADLIIPGRGTMRLESPRIMGILNVTPDSFSDGGRWTNQDQAIDHALSMVTQGADIIDVGGESTRPGSKRVSVDEQIRRVCDVIQAVRQRLDDAGHDHVVISIDTTRRDVAAAALEVGASMLNDVAAGGEDPAMFELAAASGAPICLMHMQGEPGTMQQNPRYGDVVAEVRDYLLQRADLAKQRGVAESQILIDPGIGFGKTKAHNLSLLAALDQFVATGYAVLLGTSRKRFMGAVCQDIDGNPPAPDSLIGATCATTALGVASGAAIFRVHDVLANRQAADVAFAIKHA